MFVLLCMLQKRTGTSCWYTNYGQALLMFPLCRFETVLGPFSVHYESQMLK